MKKKSYSLEDSPYAIIGRSDLDLMAANEDVLSICGYAEMVDIFGKSHRLQMLTKEDRKWLNSCQEIEVRFTMDSNHITNVYAQVYCDKIDTLLPIWELVSSVRKIAGLEVFNWTLQMDADIYAKERVDFFKKQNARPQAEPAFEQPETAPAQEPQRQPRPRFDRPRFMIRTGWM